MSKRLIATAAIAVLLAGCGKSATAPALPGIPALPPAVEAQATRTLLTSFKHIHLALFTKLDANTDNQIDEYEAGASMDLKDFGRADKNGNGKLTKTEFMNFATGGALFGFMRQDKAGFMKQTRDVLWRAFQRLDGDKNRMLKPQELGEKALQKVGINLRIDGLHAKVAIAELDDAIFEASDKTADGSLTQAEFEDYCMTAFIKGLNPAYQPGGQPAPQPDPAAGGGEEPAADAEVW